MHFSLRVRYRLRIGPRSLQMIVAQMRKRKVLLANAWSQVQAPIEAECTLMLRQGQSLMLRVAYIQLMQLNARTSVHMINLNKLIAQL